MTDQDDIVRALCEPGTYPHAPARVEHVQTHISHVFLAGPYVYKLKKAVRFPFLDFGTVELRRHFCLEEVRLNRRLAPDVYLDVVPVMRGADGRIRLGGDGGAPREILDHVVRMRRLPAERMLVSLLRRDALRPDLLVALARRLAAFHAGAPAGPEVAAHGEPALLAARWAENLRQAGVFAGTLLPAEDHALLADFGPAFVRRHETLLRARQQAGRIREGHGDLHAEHVCFLDADAPPPLPPGIQVFDCIEFSPAFRCNDVASEIAFLAMDLTVLGRPDLADGFVAAYAAAAADAGLSGLIPFYACARACIRGKVEGLASRDPELDPGARAAAGERARAHFALAVRYAWGAEGPGLVACVGLSGSGKTALAATLADATGFTHLASDVIRKRDGAAAGDDRYTAAARAAVYRRLETEVAAALAAGRSVIADATFVRRADRLRLATVASRERRPLIFVECRAGEPAVRARLEARAGTLSDARFDTYLAQRALWEPLGDDEPHGVVDTGGALADARAAGVRLLWAWRQGRRP